MIYDKKALPPKITLLDRVFLICCGFWGFGFFVPTDNSLIIKLGSLSFFFLFLFPLYFSSCPAPSNWNQWKGMIPNITLTDNLSLSFLSLFPYFPLPLLSLYLHSQDLRPVQEDDSQLILQIISFYNHRSKFNSPRPIALVVIWLTITTNYFRPTVCDNWE